eukprot:1156872-Pelagomonas_calceolata.AAC.6
MWNSILLDQRDWTPAVKPPCRGKTASTLRLGKGLTHLHPSTRPKKDSQGPNELKKASLLSGQPDGSSLPSPARQGQTKTHRGDEIAGKLHLLDREGNRNKQQLPSSGHLHMFPAP